MIKSGKHYIMSDLATVANGYATVILKVATGIYEYIITYHYILPKISIERRKYAKCRRNRTSKKLG